MSQYNHLVIQAFHVERNIDYFLCISSASRHLRTTHTTRVALTFPITTLHNDNNIVIDGMPQPPSLVSFFFFSFYFFNLLIYLFIYTVAQKIAPMFACYGKTHALLNDYIR